MVAYPKSLVSVTALVGGITLFLIFESYSLVSNPIRSTARGYFNEDDDSRNYDSVDRYSLISGGNVTLIDYQPERNSIADAKPEGTGDFIEKKRGSLVSNVSEEVESVDPPLHDLHNNFV